ncbi:hypothetical protein D3C77_517820 [compost metagenome]
MRGQRVNPEGLAALDVVHNDAPAIGCDGKKMATVCLALAHAGAQAVQDRLDQGGVAAAYAAPDLEADEQILSLLALSDHRVNLAHFSRPELALASESIDAQDLEDFDQHGPCGRFVALLGKHDPCLALGLVVVACLLLV